MLDILIEKMSSYDPQAIFTIVAMVLLIMLVRSAS
jgi:hypothetical protein